MINTSPTDAPVIMDYIQAWPREFMEEINSEIRTPGIGKS